MNKTKIEWANYTVNPVKGLCPMACSYCYARRMYNRYKWNPEIYLDTDAFTGLYKKPPARVFVGSTMELFGPWVKAEWMSYIFDQVRDMPHHTFIFLTKQVQNLQQWTFPDNCWVGVSLTGTELGGYAYPLVHLKAKVKFLSIEPLLAPVPFGQTSDGLGTLETAGISWVIIGQQTPVSKATSPKVEWIREIVEAADKARTKVFLKNNLKSLLNECDHPWAYCDGYYTSEEQPHVDRHLRQEYPVVER